MPDQEHEINEAFAALQRRVEHHVSTPDTDSIVARGRRRVAVRGAVTATMAALVLGATGVGVALTVNRPTTPDVSASQSPTPPPSSDATPTPTPSSGPASQTPPPSAAPPSQPPSPTTRTPGPTRTDLPAGFLLYEAEAARKPSDPQTGSDGWTRYNEPSLWPHSQCFDGRQSPPTMKPVAGRHLHQQWRPNKGFTEYFAVFADRTAGAKAFGMLRTELARCKKWSEGGVASESTQENVALGDEAIRVRSVRTTSPMGEPGGPRTEVWWTVFVRRGNAIVTYHGQTDRTRADSDAQRMAAKMCRYDGSC